MTEKESKKVITKEEKTEVILENQTQESEVSKNTEIVSASEESKEEGKKKKKKFRRQIQRGRAYVKSSYNNTLISLTDMHGNLLAWSSSGHLGFKGAKKSTTYAAAQVVANVDEKVQKYGLKDIEVFVKGVGSGREAAVRALAQKGYNLVMIKDMTPIPHNGCRPKKPRRV